MYRRQQILKLTGKINHYIYVDDIKVIDKKKKKKKKKKWTKTHIKIIRK